MNKHFPCGHWHKRLLSGCGRVKVSNYLFKVANNETSPIIQYTSNPFMRVDVCRIFPDAGIADEYSFGHAYGSTYDVNSGKLFVGMNATIYDEITETYTDVCEVLIYTANSLAYKNAIILESAEERTINIEGMCSYSGGGFIYVFAWNNDTKTGTVYEIDTQTEAVTRTANLVAGDGPVFQRNAMWVDCARGYIYWSCRAPTKLNGGNYIVGFNISSMAIDKQSSLITDHWWGIASCGYDKCTGILYASHPIGPTYYPTHYAVTSINVDTMTSISTIELDSPAVYSPKQIEVTESNLYLMGKTSAFGEFCIASCSRYPLAQTSRVVIDCATAPVYESTCMTVNQHDKSLFVSSYGFAVEGGAQVIIDHKYNISSLTPVLSVEHIIDDSEYREGGDHADTMTCGEIFKSY